MARSTNLDVVAPDDLIVTPPAPVPQKEVTPPPVPVKITKPVPPIQASRIEERSKKIYDLLGHAKSPFSSMLVNPKAFSFIERAEEEEILAVFRPHWVTNIRWILITILMLFAPFFVRLVPLLDFFPANYQMIFTIFWYIITFAFAFESFLSWYFDVYIITDERVVDIDFNNLINKKYSETKISMIQDLTYVVTGVVQTMFNYGVVRIQTAGQVPEIAFESVPNPEKIIKLLQILRQEEEQETLEGRVR